MIKLSLNIMLIAVLLLGITTSTSVSIYDCVYNRPTETEMLSQYILQRCQYYKIDPRIIHKMIEIESNWNKAKNGEFVGKALVKSDMGAYGLMQVRLPTAKEMLGDDSITPHKLMTDHFINVEAGIKYLNWLRDYFNGSIHLAVSAYNRGPTAVKDALKNGTNPYGQYAHIVLSSIKRKSKQL